MVGRFRERGHREGQDAEIGLTSPLIYGSHPGCRNIPKLHESFVDNLQKETNRRTTRAIESPGRRSGYQVQISSGYWESWP